MGNTTGSSVSGLRDCRRRMGVAALVLLWLAGCATQSPFDVTGKLEYSPALLTGERVFDQPLAEEELPRAAINQPSEAMLDYVATVVSDSRLSTRRFRDLFHGLTRDGYFEAVYSANRTLTAAETFEARGGNCLSYTNMFVALARAADLDARYQIVDVPPSWDAEAGFLIRYTHINVLMHNVRLDQGTTAEAVVDFNLLTPEADYPRRQVSDEYAESLFYANKSVSLLRAGEDRQALAYLAQAVRIAPHNADLWINLGAFYAVQNDFASSIEAYQVALQLDPRNKPAYSGLARSYANSGDHEMAAFYDEKVRNYRENNPYYYFALAQSAYSGADFDQSLEYINTAISLRRRTAEFHLLKGMVEYQLGQPEEGRRSVERAQRFGLRPSVKLDILRSLAGVPG